MRLVLLWIAASWIVYGQSASLRGVVTDESGALVPKATITLKTSSGPTKTAISGGDGAYVLNGIPSGSYTVDAFAPDLVLAQPITLTLKTGGSVLNLLLKVAITKQQVTVQDDAAGGV